MLKKSNISYSIFLTIAGFAFSSTEVRANERKSPLDSVYVCASVVDNGERLACFDAAVPALKVKEDKKEFLAIDAEQAREIERDSFGFSLPSLPKIGLFSKKEGEKNDGIQKFKVKSLSKTRNGMMIALENGHVWRQTSGDAGWVPKGELTAKIKPASLGSFFLSLENEKGQSGRKGMRVKRVK